MATRTWKTGATGSFSDPANWDGGVAPQPGDTAIIGSGTVAVTDVMLTNETLTFYTATNVAATAYTDSIAFTATTIGATSTVTFQGQSLTGVSGDVARALPVTVVGSLVNDGAIDIAGRSGSPGMEGEFTDIYIQVANLSNDPATPDIQNSGSILVRGSDGSVQTGTGGLIIGTTGAAYAMENSGLIEVGGLFDVLDSSANAGHSTLINTGTIDIELGGSGQIDTAVTGAGTIFVGSNEGAQTARILFDGPVTGQTVVAQLDSDVTYAPTFSTGATPVTGGSFSFETLARLNLIVTAGGPDVAKSFGAPIYGFSIGNAIDITEPAGTVINGISFDPASGVLNLLDTTTNTTVSSLTLVGAYVQNDFTLTPFTGNLYEITTGNDGNQVMGPPCFVTGTRILTVDGAVSVESICPGDIVITADGRPAPVRWVGRRTVVCAHHPRPRNVRPVRVAAGAFGPNSPQDDLWLSPDHAVAFDNALIPVRHLIDGHAITQPSVPEVTYHHIELDRHDLLLANGLPTESFLDTGQKRSFEGGSVITLHPDFSARVWEAEGCRPLHIAGPLVERARATLAEWRTREAA